MNRSASVAVWTKTFTVLLRLESIDTSSIWLCWRIIFRFLNSPVTINAEIEFHIRTVSRFFVLDKSAENVKHSRTLNEFYPHQHVILCCHVQTLPDSSSTWDHFAKHRCHYALPGGRRLKGGRARCAWRNTRLWRVPVPAAIEPDNQRLCGHICLSNAWDFFNFYVYFFLRI
jgi:hypothetical protein